MLKLDDAEYVRRSSPETPVVVDVKSRFPGDQDTSLVSESPTRMSRLLMRGGPITMPKYPGTLSILVLVADLFSASEEIFVHNHPVELAFSELLSD